MGKVILFLRVSSQQQQLESQELIARRMAHSDGYSDADILPPIKYKESASKLDEKNRKGLQELYKIIEDRNDIVALYVTELSRLSRIPNVLYSIRDFLLDKKIQLVCGEPSFHLLNRNKKIDKMAILVFAIFGAFAEQEIIEKKERFARGKEQKALEGKYVGGNIPFGYKVGENKKIEIDYLDEKGDICGDAKIVQLIFSLYEEGFSQPKLSKELTRRGYDLVPIGLINRILANESYTGVLREQKVLEVKDRTNGEKKESIRYRRVYPQLISKEQFERCRRIAESNNTTLGKTRNIYYAEHLMRCVSCGSYLSASGSKDCYRCYSAYMPKGVWNQDYYNRKKCGNRLSISINVLDSLLWHVAIDLEAKSMLEASDSKVKELQEKKEAIEQRINNVEIKISKIEAKLKRASQVYIDGDIDDDEYAEAKQRINREKQELTNEKTQYQEEISHYEDAIKVLNEGYINRRNELQNARDNGDEELEIKLVKKYKDLDDERKRKVYASIYQISDDHIRFDIIHRQIQSVKIENIEVYNRYISGWKATKAKRITIIPSNLLRAESDFLPTELKYLIVPKGGFGVKYLDENVDIDVIDEHVDLLDSFGYIKYDGDSDYKTYQVEHVDYLNRYADNYKAKKRKADKDNAYKDVQDFLRIDDVMKMTNLKYSQVYSAISSGTLKAINVRHKFFISPQDAERFKAAVSPQ